MEQQVNPWAHIIKGLGCGGFWITFSLMRSWSSKSTPEHTVDFRVSTTYQVFALIISRITWVSLIPGVFITRVSLIPGVFITRVALILGVIITRVSLILGVFDVPYT